MKKSLLVFLLYIISLSVFSQQYPVQILTNISAPAPVNFYNYADATSLNSPITVQIFLNDLTVSNRQLRLKTYFEGGNIRFQSKNVVIGAEDLFIEGGIPLILRNAELAPYYKYENIQGINAATYGQSIPEGSYDFCFEVFDYVTGNKLSVKKCAKIFIFKNEPPILNLPMNGANIEPKDFENIVFQWTPRHLNVSNVEYEFSLVEVWDNMVTPQTAFLSQTPVYQETTRATTLLYGPDKPQLLPNKRYAWRVKAKALKGLEEIGLFKNEGYSEIFWFSRTPPCEAPQNITAEAKGLTKINVFWNEDPTKYSDYIIAYREANKPNAYWFTKKTNSAWATIWNLKPGTTYEYKVKGKCTYQYSEFSKVEQVTTEVVKNDDADYQCGIVPDEIAISNRTPHPGLTRGAQITASDFKVVITEITNQSPGSLSGKGYVSVPYLKFAKFAVKFTNILVNTDNQLARGEIITVYDPNFGEGASMTVDVNINVAEAVKGDNGKIEEVYKPNYVVKEVKIGSNNEILIYSEEGGEPEMLPGGRDVEVVSKNGDVWKVSEDGKITKQKGAEGGGIAETTTTGVDTNGEVSQVTAKGVKVTFEDSGYYNFDALPNGTSSEFEAQYKIINIANGGKYKVPYKAIADNNGSDFVYAKVTITDTDIVKDSIIFKTKNGAKINVLSWSGNRAKLELKRTFDYADEQIYATVKNKEGTYDIAGSLITTHIASEQLAPINIVLVPVGDKLSNDVIEKTKEIYAKAGVRLNIKTLKDVSNKEVLDKDEIYGWDIDKNGLLEVGDSNFLSHYTNEEKAFKNYIKSQTYYNKKTYYVFVTNIPVSKSEVDGFMPLKRQFGFVFTTKARSVTKQARTLAHELGHGIFGLEHTWDKYKHPQGATNFLMDYGNGTVLNHLDWKKLHAPGIKLYWFQDDEDGEIAKKLWFTPKWEVFTVPGTKSLISIDENPIPQGTVHGFKLNGDQYKAKFQNGNFIGYFNRNKRYEYTPISISNSKKEVYLFQYNGGCGRNKYYATKYGYVQSNYNTSAGIDFSDSAVKFKGKIGCGVSNKPIENPFDKTICEYYPENNTPDQSSVNEAIENLKKSHQRRVKVSENAIRDKGDFYHLVNIQDRDYGGKSDIIEDKLFLLKQKTGINFYVVFQRVSERMSEEGTQAFAQKVLEGSGLTDSKTIVVAVPYYVAPNGVVSRRECLQVGFAQSNQNIIPSNRIQFKGSGDALSYIMGAYTAVEKPVHLFYSYVTADKDIVTISRKSTENRPNFKFINGLGIFKSKHYDELRKLEKERDAIKKDKPEKKKNESSYDFAKREKEYANKLIAWSKEYDEKRTIAEADDQNALNAVKNNREIQGYFKEVKGGAVNLREPYITNKSIENGLLASYTRMYMGKLEYGDFIVDLAYFIGTDDIKQIDSSKHLYKEINGQSAAYDILDIASLILAPTGLDVVPDAIGFIIAVSYGDTMEASFYGASVFAVGITQYGVHLAKRGKAFVLVGKYADDGATLTSYSIKKATDALEAGEKQLATSLSSKLDDVKGGFKHDFGLEFGNKLVIHIDDVVKIVDNSAEAIKARNLINKLKQIEPKVTGELTDLASKNRGTMQGLDFRLKSEESLIRKLKTDGIHTPMNDVLRYTTTFDEGNFVKGVKNTLDDLKGKGYQVVKVKNTFNEGAVYKGVNTNIKSPDGQIFELQFHTPESFNVKQNINHSLYEEFRKLDENSARAKELKRLMINNSNSIPNPPNIQSLFKKVANAGDDALSKLLKNTDYKKFYDDLASGATPRRFANELTIQEEAILKFYTTNAGYKKFNQALRGEIKMTDEFLAQEKLMNQALNKLPNSSYNKSEELFYRIENLANDKINLIYKEGTIITNKGFTSCTYSKNAVKEAMDKRMHSVLIRIKGKNAKSIENLSTLKSEKELIFKSNTRFKVNKVYSGEHLLLETEKYRTAEDIITFEGINKMYDQIRIIELIEM